MSEIKAVDDGPARSVAEAYTAKVELSEHDLQLEQALQNYVPGCDAEKKLVRKLDLFMMPTLWFMYILAYIDRQNIVSIHATVPVWRCCN